MNRLAAIRMGWIGAIVLIFARYVLADETELDPTGLATMVGLAFMVTGIAYWFSPQPLLPNLSWKTIPSWIKYVTIFTLTSGLVGVIIVKIDHDKRRSIEQAQEQSEAALYRSPEYLRCEARRRMQNRPPHSNSDSNKKSNPFENYRYDPNIKENDEIENYIKRQKVIEECLEEARSYQGK